MSWVCERCEKTLQEHFASMHVSTDFEDDQPDDPRRAGTLSWHFCKECRDGLREWVNDGA